MLLRLSALIWLALLAAGTVLAQTPAPTAAAPANPGPAIEGFTNTPMLPGGVWHQHDPNRPQPPVVTPGATFSQGAPPPSDAQVLFDGKDLSQWVGGLEQKPNWTDQPAAWKVQDGYVEVTPPDGTDIRTRGRWSDFQLHLEWAAPTPPTGHGQARGNSGVHGVAALAQHFKPGVGGKMVDAHDHSVLRADGLFVQIGNHVLLGLLGLGEETLVERGARKDCQGEKRGASPSR